jgi:two-component system, NtrC family, sensor kinase
MKKMNSNSTVLLDILPDLVFIMRCDGTILKAGAEKKEYINLLPSGSIGKNISDVFPGSLTFLIRTQVDNVLSSRETQACELQITLAKKIREFEIRTVYYSDNQILCIIREISARKNEESDTKSFLQKLLDNLPVAVFVKKADDGRFLYWNKAEADLTGVPAERALNKTDFDIVPKEQAEFFRKKDKETFLKGSVEIIPEEPIDTVYRGQRIVRTLKTPFYDENGIPLYLLGISEDITDKKYIEEELRKNREHLEQLLEEQTKTLENLKKTQSQLIQSEKMASLGQLVAGIAHEINNPVNFISAGVDSLSTNLEEIRQVLDIYHKVNESNVSEKLKEIEELKQKVEYKEAIREINKLIESIKNGTVRTTEIVKGLRTFSRLDEDVLKTTDIHEGIDSTLILLRNKYKNRIEIKKNYGVLPQVECYPGQLNQVFMNVLSNAIDAINDEGTITISTSIKGSYVQISIKDSGHGIPESLKDKIFDPFFTTKGVGKGTGLGLSISQGIIEKHNGTIEVKSKEREETEFIITLPVNPKTN